MHCIVPFACRYTLNVARQRQRCQPLPIFLATRRISFAKRSTRNFDATFCCTNAGLSLGNSINLATLYRECLEKDDTREGGFIWRAESKNQAPWMEGYWFLKIRFSREGVKNIFAFFFENVTCRVERVKVFIFKIIEFVIEFLFFFEEY